MKKIPTEIKTLSCAALIALVGCGGGGGSHHSSSTPIPQPPPAPAIDPNAPSVLSASHKPTLVGIVVDSPVINLDYTSQSATAVAASGATNSSGQFSYTPGDLITFNIGSIQLPPVVGKPVITVFDFAGTLDPTDSRVINIARLLQSFDADGDTSNGITISTQDIQAATTALDFSESVAQFKIDADPIMAVAHAAGGTPNNALIDASVAVAHLQATINALPKISPIVGTWSTGTGAGLEVMVFLENNLYYNTVASCAGVLGYNFGRYSYNAVTGQMAITDIANSGCGPSNSTFATSIDGSGNLLLGNKIWQPVRPAAGTLAGTYANGNLADSANAAVYVFTAAGEFITLDNSCGLAAQNMSAGTYTWDSNTNAMSYAITATNNGDCGMTTHDASFAHQAFLMNSNSTLAILADYGFLTFDFERLEPSRQGGALTGVWDAADPDGGGYMFTGTGKLIAESADACNPSLQSVLEEGVFIWDSATGHASVSIAQDSNGNCGLADLMAEKNSSISQLQVYGNLLDVTDNTGTVTLRRGINNAGYAGAWTRAANGATPALTVFVSDNVQEGAFPSSVIQEIASLSSDCGSQHYQNPIEVLSFLLAGTPFEMTNLTTETAPVCELSNFGYGGFGYGGFGYGSGPSFSVSGDTLTIQGLGTFTRVQ